MIIKATRYHDISCGHRVTGHEGKCRHLHGHNYRIHFTCEMRSTYQGMDEHVDGIGRVIDFSVIKSLLCMWLEDNWDHKMLIWEHDPLVKQLQKCDPTVVVVPFNPTAENIAEHLLNVIGPQQLSNTQVRLTRVMVEETAKCSAEAKI